MGKLRPRTKKQNANISRLGADYRRHNSTGLRSRPSNQEFNPKINQMSYEDRPKYQFFYDVSAEKHKGNKYYKVEFFVNRAPTPEENRGDASIRWVGSRFFWLDEHAEPFHAAVDYGIATVARLDELQDPTPKQSFFDQ